jgi:hypothetical protein
VNKRKLLPIAIALVLPWLTIAEANAGRDLVYSNMVTLAQGEYLQLSFDAVFLESYTICVMPFWGDADLYAYVATWATNGEYSDSSTNGGQVTDCVYWGGLDAPYYYSIYGYTDTEFLFWVYED